MDQNPATLGDYRLVTAVIEYFIPRREQNAPPLVVAPTLIGQAPTVLSHAGLLQQFTWQQFDLDETQTPRIQTLREHFHTMLPQDEAGRDRILDGIFRRAAKGGGVFGNALVAAVDRAGNVQMPSSNLTQEEAFRAMVPFPGLRKFLQYWAENIEGPIHSVRFANRRLIGAASTKAGWVGDLGPVLRN